MFQFTQFALSRLYIQREVTLAGWVSPFRNLWINAYLSAPQSLSQTIASFIACNRQGIHHMHLVTWLYIFEPLLTAKPINTVQCFVCDCYRLRTHFFNNNNRYNLTLCLNSFALSLCLISLFRLILSAIIERQSFRHALLLLLPFF